MVCVLCSLIFFCLVRSGFSFHLDKNEILYGQRCMICCCGSGIFLLPLWHLTQVLQPLYHIPFLAFCKSEDTTGLFGKIKMFCQKTSHAVLVVGIFGNMGTGTVEFYLGIAHQHADTGLLQHFQIPQIIAKSDHIL